MSIYSSWLNDGVKSQVYCKSSAQYFASLSQWEGKDALNRYRKEIGPKFALLRENLESDSEYIFGVIWYF